MIAPVLLMGRGLLPPRKAKHGVSSCSSESFKSPAVKASCREKNTPTPELSYGIFYKTLALLHKYCYLFEEL
jgi:hypothetical protein